MAEWIALERVDPWGEWRADLRAGIVASTIANVNRGKKDKAFSAQDFMPDFRTPKEKRRARNKGIRASLRETLGVKKKGKG